MPSVSGLQPFIHWKCFSSFLFLISNCSCSSWLSEVILSCPVPLKGSTPPCLAQHLCSVLLCRLRCASAKVPLTTPLQPVTKIPNPACRDTAVCWLSGHMLIQRATVMQGWRGKAWASSFSTLGVRISKASEPIFLAEFARGARVRRWQQMESSTLIVLLCKVWTGLVSHCR